MNYPPSSPVTVVSAIIAAITLTIYPVFFFWRIHHLKRTGIRTTATVVRHQLTPFWRYGTNKYLTLIKFMTDEEETIEATTKVALPFPAFHEGNTLTIYYEKTAPRNFALDSLPEKSVLLFFTVIGWLLAGIFIYKFFTN